MSALLVTLSFISVGRETSAEVISPLTASVNDFSVEGAAGSLTSTGICSGPGVVSAEASSDLYSDFLLVVVEVFLVAATPGGLAALAAALAAATRLAASVGLAGLRPEVAALSVAMAVTLAVVEVPVLAVVLVPDLADPEVLVVTVVLVFAAALEAAVLLLFGLAVAEAVRGAVVEVRGTPAVGTVLADPVLETAEAVTGALAAFTGGNFLAEAEDAVDSVPDMAEDVGRAEAGREEAEAALVEGSEVSEPGLTRDGAVTLELDLDIGLAAVLSAPSPGFEVVVGPGFFRGTVLGAAAAGALGRAPAVVPPAPPALFAGPALPPAGLDVGRGAPAVLDAAPAGFAAAPAVFVVPAAGFGAPVDAFVVPAAGDFVAPTAAFVGFAEDFGAASAVLAAPEAGLGAAPAAFERGSTSPTFGSEGDWSVLVWSGISALSSIISTVCTRSSMGASVSPILVLGDSPLVGVAGVNCS